MEDKKTPLHELMEGDITLISAATCVLARLWRLLLFQLNVRASIWETLLRSYTEDCMKHMDKKKATNLKGNISKDLAKPTVAWYRLCQGISVFDFEETFFCLVLHDGDTVKEVSIKIPRTYKDEAGKLLKVMWDSVLKEFPDRAENWKEYMKNYVARCKEQYGEDSTYMRGNVTQALCDESITWTMAYRGLVACNFDRIDVKLMVKQRGFPDYQVVDLKLKRKN